MKRKRKVRIVEDITCASTMRNFRQEHRLPRRARSSGGGKRKQWLRYLGDLVVHANVLVGVGLGSSAVGRSSFTRGIEIINHLSVKFLDSLRLSAAGVATATGSAATTARALLSSGGLVLLLSLRSSGRLGTCLLTTQMNEYAIVSVEE